MLEKYRGQLMKWNLEEPYANRNQVVEDGDELYVQIYA